MVGFGLGFGAHMALYHINCIDVHGAALFSSCVTLSAGLQACGYFIMGVVLGKLKTLM